MDTSFLGSNVSANSWFSMATNVTTLISQVSGAIAAFWGNNTNEDNEFTASIEDDNLPDGGAASDSNVYKGWIKENVPSLGIRKRAIAVKKLDANSKQGFRQWRTEVGFLARLSHPNIVKLLGYCKENENFLIVYEFMQKGSLNYHLFGRSSDRLLPWEARLKIMTGMAQGLSYLHMMEKPIIFRDFKSSNVLLDEILATSGDSHVTGHVVGTVGYTAPEYIAAGWLYVKSDVYSFGVVTVEMLTGRKAIDKNRPSSERYLVEWVKPYLKQKAKLRKVIDSRLEGKFSPKEAIEIALVAIALVADKCLNSNHKCRPSMIEVAERLKKIEARYRTINEG